MQSQASEASCREGIQKSVHAKILVAVNELIRNQDNQPVSRKINLTDKFLIPHILQTTILNLMNFKNIITEADGALRASKASIKPMSGDKKTDERTLASSYAQIEEKNEIIEKYEAQNKHFIQEISDV